MQALAAALADLAPEQVEAVDAFGAFVDRVQAVVAPVLLQRVFTDVARAAEDLNADIGGDHPVFRGIGLDHGDQQVEQFGGIGAGVGIRCGVGVLEQAAGVQAQRQAAFGIGLLLQQHAPYVGVLDDTHLRCQRVLVARQTALWPLAGVIEGMDIALVGQCRGA
ncbi:hypothetical protein D3C79_844510 [compost metagenome]